MLWLVGLWVAIVLGLVSYKGQVMVTSHSTTECTVRPIPRPAGAEVEHGDDKLQCTMLSMLHFADAKLH